MIFTTTRARRAAGVIAALAAGALAISAPAASASAAGGFISGGGSVYDDFGDEGTISTTSAYRNSNVACLWQQILWAEGVKESNGTAFDKSDADGRFGANSAYATKQLQKRWGLTADGVVGKGTFGKVDTKRQQIGGEWTGRLLHVGTDTSDPDEYYKLRYYGKSETLTFYRDDTGRYRFHTGQNSFAYVAYGHNSCD
ncbi:peptidoglycan-binding domain-containing protein [Streptomyces longispororuber]|uniref:peptidoglycan-binding domain-containing protein n=1 Tax=Streptomyces longispororuber TaxID=68230 RepID=UPI00210E45FC|nr:peptidoglycan-binding domain-containing protein [Streptomyces longispororuber]MCQ4205914.1 peptidoglycan-binding protein [Streptomyces longispororuber]